MSGGELAGRLDARVSIARAGLGRDALGAADGGWTPLGETWAAVEPIDAGPALVGDARAALPRWRVTLRTRGLLPGDRLGWSGRTMTVREVRADPATPDRITLIAEEER